MEAMFEWKIDELDLVSVVIRMTVAEAEALVAGFDEASASSPTASDSREVARPVAIAIRDSLG